MKSGCRGQGRTAIVDFESNPLLEVTGVLVFLVRALWRGSLNAYSERRIFGLAELPFCVRTRDLHVVG
jgi:hypothetical protein